MGARVNFTIKNLLILKEHENACYEAIQEAMPPTKRFSWNCTTEHKTLQEIFEDFGFDCTPTEHGLGINQFDNEKSGDEELFFPVIAPFVRHGGMIRIADDYGGDKEFLFEHEKLLIIDYGSKEFRKRARDRARKEDSHKELSLSCAEFEDILVDEFECGMEDYQSGECSNVWEIVGKIIERVKKEAKEQKS